MHVRRVKQQVLEEVLASMTAASEQPSAPRAQARGASMDGHDALPDALGIKELRARTKLSQSDFAALLGVELSTLRNWEQGRRVPAGPARALLRAIRNDPQNVIRALARAA
jgi:putative transcriptional regulator